MRPRIPVPLTLADRAACSVWSRRTLAVCGLIALAMIAISATNRHIDDTILAAHADTSATALQSCARWHESASGAVSQLTQTMRDADLRQVADATFRMRRALRNCEMGWLRLACQDYRAVIKGVPGHASESAFECPTASQTWDARTIGSSRMSP